MDFHIGELKGLPAIIVGAVLTFMPKVLGYVFKEGMQAYAMYRNRGTRELASKVDQLVQSMEEDRRARKAMYERMDQLAQRVAKLEGLTGQ